LFVSRNGGFAEAKNVRKSDPSLGGEKYAFWRNAESVDANGKGWNCVVPGRKGMEAVSETPKREERQRKE